MWILLKQETVSGSGISWAICKSAPRSRQITTSAPTTQYLRESVSQTLHAYEAVDQSGSTYASIHSSTLTITHATPAAVHLGTSLASTADVATVQCRHTRRRGTYHSTQQQVRGVLPAMMTTADNKLADPTSTTNKLLTRWTRRQRRL